MVIRDNGSKIGNHKGIHAQILAAGHTELLAIAPKKYPSMSVGMNFYGLIQLVNSSPEGLTEVFGMAGYWVRAIKAWDLIFTFSQCISSREYQKWA